jgi:SPASM domain peptide maturase of grasp-with-spasm system
MNEQGPTFRLFACCIPVMGARRSTLCDLQRHTFVFIPNALYCILTEQHGRTLNEVKSAYAHQHDQAIEEYFTFLIENEFGFWCDDPHLFPDISLEWKTPERITNAIIDADLNSRHDYGSIFRQLDDLGCKHVELRFYDALPLAALSAILVLTKESRLKSIDLLIRHEPGITPLAIERLTAENRRIAKLVIHDAPVNSAAITPAGVQLLFLNRHIDSPNCCGEVNAGYFFSNLQCFSEAQKFNTCLNKKISVDARGEIKNCPSMAKSFGNVCEVSLHDALARRDFQDLWFINKDRIDVCRDCEFRYVCTDCRAYISKPDNIYSKPSKCRYDPYTAQWRN